MGGGGDITKLKILLLSISQAFKKCLANVEGSRNFCLQIVKSKSEGYPNQELNNLLFKFFQAAKKV